MSWLNIVYFSSLCVEDGHAEQDATWSWPQAVRADRDGPGDRVPGGVVPVLLQTRSAHETLMCLCVYRLAVYCDLIWTLLLLPYPGFGVDQLRDDNLETYWQSDGSQPHLVNIQFRCRGASGCIWFSVVLCENLKPDVHLIAFLSSTTCCVLMRVVNQSQCVWFVCRRRTTVKMLCIYADYKSDESYTPSKISVRVGNNFHNLQEIRVTTLYISLISAPRICSSPHLLLLLLLSAAAGDGGAERLDSHLSDEPGDHSFVSLDSL